MNTTRLISIAILLMVAAVAQADTVGSSRFRHEERAPVIDAKDFNPGSMDGSVTLLHFWISVTNQSRSPDSEAALNWLTHMQEWYGKAGLKIVAVNLDQETNNASGDIGSLHRNITVVLDPYRKIAGRYEVDPLPATYLLNTEGQVLSILIGFTEEAGREKEAEVKEVLASTEAEAGEEPQDEKPKDKLPDE